MAERTTVNVGEPADERSVDAPNSRPHGKVSEGGDQEGTGGRSTGFGINSGDYNHRLSKVFADLNAANRSEFHFYDDDGQHDDDEGPPPSASTDNEWNGKNSEDFQICKSDVCFKIAPIIGAVSYEYFSLRIMNPSWFLRAFFGIEQRVSNALWYQSQVGIGLYIYSHKHIQALTMSRRVLYSVFGSLVFNYSSCFFWAFGKRYLPCIESIQVGFGLLTGWFLLFVGREYLHHVDKMCSDQLD